MVSSCNDPDDNEENPDLRVVNNLTGYKISNVIVNVQLFMGEDDYLSPGRHTVYMNVNPGESLLLGYHWVNVNDTSDKGDYSRLTGVGDYPELIMNKTYTLTYSGDKERPTINISEP